MPRLPRRAVAIALAVFVAVVVSGVSLDSLRAEPALGSGSGSLTVDEVVYRFTPTTCVISDEDFVAAGVGRDASEQFWVSASSVSVDLTFGTENELDVPTEGQLWLVSQEVTSWSAEGQTVTAQALMQDRNAEGSEPVIGSLVLRCDERAGNT